jgi:hypothetical protein
MARTYPELCRKAPEGEARTLRPARVVLNGGLEAACDVVDEPRARTACGATATVVRSQPPRPPERLDLPLPPAAGAGGGPGDEDVRRERDPEGGAGGAGSPAHVPSLRESGEIQAELD